MIVETFIITQSGCPFCEEAKTLLNNKGINYKEFTIEEYEDKFKGKIDLVPFTCSMKDGKKRCVKGFDKFELTKII